MKSGIKLYSRISDHETILELWGASTKHPDSRFSFSHFEKTPLVSDQVQIYQWLLECASRLTWWFFARDLVNFANEYYDRVIMEDN